MCVRVICTRVKRLRTVKSAVLCGVLLLSCSSHQFLNAAPITPAATSVWNGGTGDWDDPANWIFPPGIPQATYQVLINTGSATLNSQSPDLNNLFLGSPASLTVNGSLSAGSYISNGALTLNSGSTLNSGTTGFAQDGANASVLVKSGAQFLDLGSYSQGNGSTTVNGRLDTTLFHVTGGAVSTGSGGVMNIGSGGYTQDNSVTTTIGSGSQVNVTGSYAQGSGSTSIAGTLNTSLFHVSGGSVSVTDGGALDIGSGGYTQGTEHQTGTSTTIASGAKLNITGGDFSQELGTTTLVDGQLLADTVHNSGIFSGAGSVTGQFVNLGSLDPGDSGIGTFSIVGDYSQTGFLDSFIGGLHSVNLLDIDGSAALSGTLDVTFAKGFIPSIGDTFQVMQFDSYSGQFANVMSTSLPSNELLEVLYSSLGVSVTIVAPTVTTTPEPGALSLLAFGLGLMLFSRFRRRA